MKPILNNFDRAMMLCDNAAHVLKLTLRRNQNG